MVFVIFIWSLVGFFALLRFNSMGILPDRARDFTLKHWLISLLCGPIALACLGIYAMSDGEF